MKRIKRLRRNTSIGKKVIFYYVEYADSEHFNGAKVKQELGVVRCGVGNFLGYEFGGLAKVCFEHTNIYMYVIPQAVEVL